MAWAGFTTTATVSFAAEREKQLDALGDLIADHIDTDRLAALIDGGVPTDLPDLLLERAAAC